METREPNATPSGGKIHRMETRDYPASLTVWICPACGNTAHADVDPKYKLECVGPPGSGSHELAECERVRYVRLGGISDWLRDRTMPAEVFRRRAIVADEIERRFTAPTPVEDVIEDVRESGRWERWTVVSDGDGLEITRGPSS